MTSASRTDPPGCTTAVAPAAATASSPSRNGKNASDAATVPASEPAGLHHRDVHRVDAAHLPGADRQRAVRAGEDHGVRLHVRADAPREAQRLHSSGVGCRLVTTLRHVAVPATGSRASTTRSRSCTSIAAEESSAAPASARADRLAAPAKSAVTTRMFCLASPGSARASSSTAGAITASMNVDDDRLAPSPTSIGAVQADDAAERRQRIGVARAHVGVARSIARSRRRTGWCA